MTLTPYDQEVLDIVNALLNKVDKGGDGDGVHQRVRRLRHRAEAVSQHLPILDHYLAIVDSTCDRASAQHCTDATLRLVQRALVLRAEFGKDEDWRRLVSSFGAVYVRNLAAAFHPHQHDEEPARW